MFEISIIIDPNELHVVSSVGLFSELAMFAKMLNIVESFQSLGFTIEKDEERNFCYWVLNNNKDAVFYIETNKVKTLRVG
jgi:hypothetical protein